MSGVFGHVPHIVGPTEVGKVAHRVAAGTDERARAFRLSLVTAFINYANEQWKKREMDVAITRLWRERERSKGKDVHR